MSMWDWYKNLVSNGQADPNVRPGLLGGSNATIAPPDQPPTPPSAPEPQVQPLAMPSMPSMPSMAPIALPKEKEVQLNDLTGEDAAKEKALEDQLATRRKINFGAGLLGGVGDVLATANQAYGVKAPNDTQENINKEGLASETTSRANLARSLSNDPLSDESKAYQNTLARFLGKDATDPSISKMSADQIQAQVPAIEKLAGLETNKQMKVMQMQLMQQGKEQQLDQRKQMTFVRLSSSLSGDKELNNIKDRVDNIERAYPALERGSVSPNQFAEAGIATLRVISPNGIAGYETLKKFIPRTVGTDSSSLIQWITNKPQDPHVQQFLGAWKNLLNQEEGVARMQYERAFNRKMAGIKPILDSNPDVGQQLYQDWGVKHPVYNPQGTNTENMGVTTQPGAQTTGNQGLPQVGQTYQGGKVLKVTRIQ